MIVGMCLDVDRNKLTLDDVKKALDKKERLPRNWSVPAIGLFLCDIKYPEDIPILKKREPYQEGSRFFLLDTSILLKPDSWCEFRVKINVIHLPPLYGHQSVFAECLKEQRHNRQISLKSWPFPEK